MPLHDLPALGAFPSLGATTFHVPAPGRRRVELVIESGARAGVSVALTEVAASVFGARVTGVVPGDRYRYRLDGEGPFPDPASRWQPDGVHGASAVTDPSPDIWSVRGWTGVPYRDLVIYELHVGAFTQAGTYAAAVERLDALRALGITAVELMPVHDFPGDRNWGYDPAALFAPARAYGTPDDLRAFVDAAHGMGLAVIVDVVYNHLGPDGAYLAAFHRGHLTKKHANPWGAGVDLDGPHSAVSREFLIQNAVMWLTEYRMDGLRLDATQALRDASPRHFITELAARCRAATTGREIALIAEDGRNNPIVLTAARDGGHELDGEWSFDFHHQVHHLLTGERHAYYADFVASLDDLATILRHGWLHSGEPSSFRGGAPHGGQPPAVHPSRFVFYLQSHDEVGNRGDGMRLHVLSGMPGYRAAMTLLLLSPQTPMLFMGEEWAASAPFVFFTDHKPDLGRRVEQARRDMLKRWGYLAVASPPEVPDPQDPATLAACTLDWSERDVEPHASALRLVQALLSLRRETSGAVEGATHDVRVADDRAIVLVRRAPGATAIAVVAMLTGDGTVDLEGDFTGVETLLTTEDRSFATDSVPLRVEAGITGVRIHFSRPGAWVVKWNGAHHRP